MFGNIGELVQRAQRVLNVAYRPTEKEYMKMAKITGFGIILLGIFGAIILFIFGLIY